MRFAYADPPYIGQAKRHYGCPEVDHAVLLAELEMEFPDGWALSCSSTTLGEILPMIGVPYRIGSWCKSFCAFKRNVRPAYAWEPVIFAGGRNPCNGHRAVIPAKNGKQLTPKDFIVEPNYAEKGLGRRKTREGLPMDFGFTELSARRLSCGFIPRHRSDGQSSSAVGPAMNPAAKSLPGMTVKKAIELLQAMPDKTLKLMIDCPYCGKGNQLCDDR